MNQREIEWMNMFLPPSISTSILVNFITGKKKGGNLLTQIVSYECCCYCEQKGDGVDWEEETNWKGYSPNTGSGNMRNDSEFTNLPVVNNNITGKG